MAREPRTVLEVGAMVAVWIVALLGCQPESRRSADTVASAVSADAGHTGPNGVSSDQIEHKTSNTGNMPSSVPIGDNEAVDPNVLFQGWPDPEFAFLITGQQRGYIEPCGCTGLENQKGGLARRHTLATGLEKRGWPLLAIDVGNQVRRVGVQAEIKFQMTLEGLNTIGYDAMTLGINDLRLSVGELVAVTADFEGKGSLFMSANVAILDRSLTPRHRILEVAGKKVGVTAVIGDAWLTKVKSDEIVVEPAADALQQVADELESEKCDLYVLLAHADLDESIRLAETFPLFDIVVTAGGDGDPTFRPETVGPHEAMLVQVGIKGMFVGVVGVFGEGQPLRYQRVPLDASFADSPPMMALLASYQGQLEELGLEGLGVRPLPHPNGGNFVGSKKCAECHEEAFGTWEGSPHADATDKLVNPNQRSEIARHFDPECLSCHVTGWNAERFFPYTSGYLSLEGSPLLHGSGCENCHGPGSDHVTAEEGDIDATEERLLELRKAMQLPLSRAEQHCMTCHDLDNSPDFHDDGAFEKFWEMVEH
jgi:hypothetical protein